MIIRLKLLHSKYIALTIWPFIFVKEHWHKTNKILVNHEKIHLKQQIELLWVPFFIWYFTEFIFRFFQYKNWDKAYRAISFEREAYAQEKNYDYLENRKLWAFLSYLKKKYD